jgi:hypothetical protein
MTIDTEAVETADAPLSDEITVEPKAEATPAAEPEDEPEAADDTGDETSEQEAEKPKREPWFQKRINEVTAAKYEEQRRADQLQAQLDAMRQESPQQQDEPPKLEDFNWDEAAYQKANADYFRKLATNEVKSLWEQQQQDAAHQTKLQQMQGRMAEAAAKYPDFQEIADHIPANEAVQDLLLNADNAIDVLHEIGKDPAEAHRVFSLSPYLQAVEMGRISARLEGPSTPQRKNIAPPPPKTVKGLSAGMTKSPEDMSMDEYRAWANKRDNP